MTDIRRQDSLLFRKEALSGGRIFLSLFFSAIWSGIASMSGMPLGLFIGGLGAIFTIHLLAAYSASIRRRWLSKRFEAHWNGCVDRLKLFDEVRERMRRDKVGDWEEMPKTVERVAKSLYAALRRADMISHEVALTEKGLYNQPPPWVAPSHDPQAKELYRIADKNIAEYRQQFGAVMAGVQRTEAQCAVFMTTVDTLRMKMIGYRLVGRSPELSSQDFLEAMNEAKLQLRAIDEALEELELQPLPKTIAIQPPSFPEQSSDERRVGSSDHDGLS